MSNLQFSSMTYGQQGPGGLGNEYEPPYVSENRGALSSYYQHTMDKDLEDVFPKDHPKLKRGKGGFFGDLASDLKGGMMWAPKNVYGSGAKPKRKMKARGMAVGGRRPALRASGMSEISKIYSGMDRVRGMGAVKLRSQGKAKPKRKRGGCGCCGAALGEKCEDWYMPPEKKYKRCKKYMQAGSGVIVGGKRRMKRGGDAAAKRSPWIKFVKEFAQQHGISYKEALQQASPAYHALMG